VPRKWIAENPTVLAQGNRPRELRWYHAGPMLFGDWGTSRLYVLGIAFAATGRASIWFMLAMSGLLVAVAWAYSIICRLYPDGGGVYSAARQRSHLLAVVGALLLCADYVVTASLSALDAFHYLHLPRPEIWAAASIAGIGFLNWFGPTKAGTGAMVVAILTVGLTMTIGVQAAPTLGQAQIELPRGTPVAWWSQFTALILAISGVEAVANMTGIMVRPVERTSRLAIWPVLIEIVILNLVLTLAMQALPTSVLDPAHVTEQQEASMLRILAEYYVGPVFAAFASLVFALLLLSAVNTAITDLVSIQYMMSRDRELPPALGGLNFFGMPVVPLVIGAIVPAVTVLLVPDVKNLADLYAIGVVGAVAINIGACSTNRAMPLKAWERKIMIGLAVFMVAVWVTIAVEKPFALAFAGGIMVLGLIGRWVAHNRERIGEWMMAPVEGPIVVPREPAKSWPVVESIKHAPEELAEKPPAPAGRVLVSTRGNPKLLRFALEQAKARNAELLVLFVRHVAIPTLGPAAVADPASDPEAQAVFRQAEKMGAEEHVPVRGVYAVARDVAEAILETAATHGVDLLLLGATQRGGLWRTMKGDVIQEVAQYLPERINLLIHA
jgi:amino acid transporter/nucleotide-binding universal stress UspA family protein